jgi:hypothetical protein
VSYKSVKKILLIFFLILCSFILIGIPSSRFVRNWQIQHEVPSLLRQIHAELRDIQRKDPRFDGDLNLLKTSQSVRYSFGFLMKKPQSSGLILQNTLSHQIVWSNSLTNLEKETILENVMKACPDCYFTNKTFKIFAVGNIDNDPKLDLWTINQEAQIQHLIDDSIK